MSDQAAQLRQLMWRARRAIPLPPAPAPRCVAVVGGERGTGCTAVAIELAAALVELGARVVLVDLDPHAAGVARECRWSIPVAYRPEVAHRDIHEALQLGPRGIQLVPGVWDAYPVKQPELRLLPLLAQLAQLGRHADMVVLDVGPASGLLLRNLGNFTDLTLFVTSTLASAITRTYTLIKKNVAAGVAAELGLLINRAAVESDAREACDGMERSIRRFLSRELAVCGMWPDHASAAERRSGLLGVATWCMEQSGSAVAVPAKRAAA